MNDKMTTGGVRKRIRELGKQQLLSEIGCVVEHKDGRIHKRRMKCIFQTSGLGMVETNASKIDISGLVNLEIYDAREGFIPLNGVPIGDSLDDLKGTERTHDGFKLIKSGVDSRGIEYKDKIGNKWQIPLNKQSDKYHTKVILRAPDKSNFWCRVSLGSGGSYVGVGQKIKCDSRKVEIPTSIL